jgi:hypothetical protein
VRTLQLLLHEYDEHHRATEQTTTKPTPSRARKGRTLDVTLQKLLADVKGIDPTNSKSGQLHFLAQSISQSMTNRTPPVVASASQQLARSKEHDCVVCMERSINTVLLECGHRAVCTECAPQLHDCPICRSRILRIVRIYDVY